MDTSSLARAARLIATADALFITAGAGMGVDSGLPDFRGRQGFWRAYPAVARARIDFEEVASPASFRRDPVLAWGFYGHRLATACREFAALASFRGCQTPICGVAGSDASAEYQSTSPARWMTPPARLPNIGRRSAWPAFSHQRAPRTLMSCGLLPCSTRAAASRCLVISQGMRRLTTCRTGSGTPTSAPGLW